MILRRGGTRCSHDLQFPLWNNYVKLEGSNFKGTSCSRIIAWSVNDLSCLLRPEKKREGRERASKRGKGSTDRAARIARWLSVSKNGDSWVNLRVESGSLCSGTLPTLSRASRPMPAAVWNWQPPFARGGPTGLLVRWLFEQWSLVDSNRLYNFFFFLLIFYGVIV